jgi:membrane protease YdiL (CAAX protease family)
MDAPDPSGEFLFPPEYYSAPPAAPLRPRFHPVWRTLLYLLAWIVASTLLQVMAVVGYVLALAIVHRGNVRVTHGMLGGDTGELPPVPVVGLTTLAELAATIGVTVLFMQFLTRRPVTALGLAPGQRWWRDWLLGFGVEGLHFSLVFLVGLLAGWYTVTGVSGFLQSVGILLVAFVIAIPAAAVEEITIRGYVLQTLREQYGTKGAVLISSAVFALLHGLNPGGASWAPMVGIFLAGVYLSLAYLATGRLWYPIALHAMWNVCEGPIYGLPVSGLKIPQTLLHVRAGGPPLWTGGPFGPEAGLLVFLTTALWAGVAWAAARRWLDPPPDRGDESEPLAA